MLKKMKRLPELLLLIAGIIIVAAGTLTAQTKGTALRKEKMRTDTISVPQMQCGSCEERIAGRLAKLSGVATATADAEAKHVIVTYSPRKVKLEKITKEIAATGYNAGNEQTTAELQAKLPRCCQPGGHH